MELERLLTGRLPECMRSGLITSHPCDRAPWMGHGNTGAGRAEN